MMSVTTGNPPKCVNHTGQNDHIESATAAVTSDLVTFGLAVARKRTYELRNKVRMTCA